MAERIEWELVCNNGTCIRLKDVHFERDMAEVADCANPGWSTRLPIGPVRISAIMAGTELEPEAEEQS